MPICDSPWLFAAYRVLRRQSVPWHPPCALIRLISRAFSSSPVLLSYNPNSPKTFGARSYFVSSVACLSTRSLFDRSSFLPCAVFKVRARRFLRAFEAHIELPLKSLSEDIRILSSTFVFRRIPVYSFVLVRSFKTIQSSAFVQAQSFFFSFLFCLFPYFYGLDLGFASRLGARQLSLERR